MKDKVQRSLLIMPVNVPRFVEKAHLRDADAIILDLEDGVPDNEKERARSLLGDSVRLAGRGGADVMVRVNNEPSLLLKDLECAVQPGVNAVFLPKTEHEEQVRSLAREIARLEAARNMEPCTVGISLHIESPKGILALERIAAASSGIESMSIGVDDYCLEAGLEPGADGAELLFPFSRLATVCTAWGCDPVGVLGSVAAFTDAGKFERDALASRRLGFTGAYCIHPGQVAILNRVFSPRPEDVEYSRRVVDAFMAALDTGRGAVGLDGKVVDKPVYIRAKRILEWEEAVAKREAQKAAALSQLSCVQPPSAR